MKLKWSHANFYPTGFKSTTFTWSKILIQNQKSSFNIMLHCAFFYKKKYCHQSSNVNERTSDVGTFEFRNVAKRQHSVKGTYLMVNNEIMFS